MNLYNYLKYKKKLKTLFSIYLGTLKYGSLIDNYFYKNDVKKHMHI